MSRIERMRVALVGRRLSDNENLGLGYLQAALSQAGIQAKRHVLNGANHIGPVADSILRDSVELVGISIADGGSATIALAFGEMLRCRGYSGTIIAGGPFATLARDWLLQRYEWLAAVVRFAGEMPLVGVASALAEGRSFEGVAGVSTRRGDGAPAPVAASQPLMLFPSREEQPRLLGHRVAHVQTTRGCAGRCGYCGPAALQSLEYGEGLRAGIAPSELRKHGVGGVRRRTVEHLAQEIRQLYERGTRYIYLVDEHFLPYRTTEALEYLARLRDELLRRKVGRFGLGCMLKAERLNVELLDSLAEIGMVRAFLGLEFSSAEEGRLYQRRVDPSHGRRLMAQLEERGTACVANLMLVHPYSTRDTIRAGIDHLGSIESGVVETTRMMVYHGTQLLSELEQTGRLTGNPLRYGYTLEDPVAQRFSEAFAPLRLSVFGDHSLAQVTHGVAMTLALARWLHAERRLDAIQAEYRAVERTVRQFTTDCVRRVFHVAHSAESSSAAMQTLLAELAETALLLRRRVDRLENEIPRALRIHHQRFAPTRAAAARTLAFTLLGTAAAACSTHENSQLWSTSNGGTTSGSGGFTLVAGAGGTTMHKDCSSDEEAVFRAEAESIVQQQDACFSGWVSPAIGRSDEWSIESSVTSSDCSSHTVCSPLSPVNEASIVTALDAAAPDGCSASLRNIRIAGGAQSELDSINASVKGCVPEPMDSFSIQVDAQGNLLDVTSATMPAATIDCIRAALKGLRFPCLGSAEICPEPCIIE